MAKYVHVGPDMLDTLDEQQIIAVSKIIVSRSDVFCRRFPFLSVEDCIQVSWKELIQYQNYYDPNRGTKVTSWVYKLVNDTLTSYAQKEYNKTQKWDNIEESEFLDIKVVLPDKECAYTDLVEVMRTVLSPRCCAYLKVLEKDPRVCIANLAKQLGLSERDLEYLRAELRLTVRHIIECNHE